jgi:hypothetical protein
MTALDDPPQPPADYLDLPAPGWPIEEQRTSARRRPNYVDIAALLDGRLPEPPKPAVLRRDDGLGLFYRGEMNLVYGDPEAGKSWVCDAAVAETLSAGERALILDLDHNGVASTTSRLLALGAPWEAVRDPDRFHYIAPDDADEIADVIADATEWRPAIAIIDSIGELLPALGLSSNSPDDYSSLHTRVLKPLAIAGAAVLGVDHLSLGQDSRASGPTGTRAKLRVVGGTALRVTAREPFAPGRGGSCQLRIRKDRHGGLRAHCPPGREPVAGTFEIEQHGAVLTWSIREPSPEAFRFDGGPASDDDVAELDALDPPPRSQIDVKRRLGWGSDRAMRALKRWRDLNSSTPDTPGVLPERGPETAPLLPSPVRGGSEERTGDDGEEPEW